MNLAHFKLVRRQIADLQPGQFKMESWESECGTTACLAGWINKLNDSSGEYNPFIFARDFLDISTLAADWLFFAGWRMHELPINLYWVTGGDLALADVSRNRVLQELDAWIAAKDVPEHLREKGPSDADNYQEPTP